MPFLARNSLVLIASQFRPVLYLTKSESFVMLLKNREAKVEKKWFVISEAHLKSFISLPCLEIAAELPHQRSFSYSLWMWLIPTLLFKIKPFLSFPSPSLKATTDGSVRMPQKSLQSHTLTEHIWMPCEKECKLCFISFHHPIGENKTLNFFLFHRVVFTLLITTVLLSNRVRDF